MDFSAITDSGRAAATVKVGKEFIYLFIFSGFGRWNVAHPSCQLPVGSLFFNQF